MSVSILVVLDVVLEERCYPLTFFTTQSFNPCCAGCSSGRGNLLKCSEVKKSVSILVVLDVVLEGFYPNHHKNGWRVSILVVLDVVLEGWMMRWFN